MFRVAFLIERKEMIKDRIAKVDFTPIVAEVVKWRMNSDIASIGGAAFEAALAEALSNESYVVYTQKEVATLVEKNAPFKFPVPWETIQEQSHLIGSPFYAVDLFEFERVGGTLVMTDLLSLKTSVTDSNALVYVVNDNEGVVCPNYLDGKDTYLGKVLTAIIRPSLGVFSVFYFDGNFSEVIAGLSPNKDSKDNLVFRKEGGKRTALVRVCNRQSTKKGNAKTTSFDRGVTVKPSQLDSFAECVVSGQFDSVHIKDIIVSNLLSR